MEVKLLFHDFSMKESILRLKRVILQVSTSVAKKNKNPTSLVKYVMLSTFNLDGSKRFISIFLHFFNPTELDLKKEWFLFVFRCFYCNSMFSSDFSIKHISTVLMISFYKLSRRKKKKLLVFNHQFNLKWFLLQFHIHSMYLIGLKIFFDGFSFSLLLFGIRK